MYCSRCRSDKVHRSQSSDFLIYRLVLLARVRCHNCGHRFFANCWRVKTEALVRQVDLSQFDQQLLAVLLKQVDDEFVFRGSGSFQKDDELGRILRVSNDDPNEPEIIILEGSWGGRITPDFQYGCRFLIQPVDRQ